MYLGWPGVQTLKTWSVLETLLSVVSFALITLLSAVL